MSEEWRPVPGFGWRYEVSNFGRVRSWVRPGDNRGVRDDRPHLLIPTGAREYLKVLLSDRGRRVQLLVAPLVAEVFIGPRPKGLQCAHLNGDPHDNRAVNLKWSTRKENERHKRLHGTYLHGEKCHNARLTDVQVDEIRSAWNDYHRGLGSELAAKYGVHKSTISAIVTGRNRSHADDRTG